MSPDVALHMMIENLTRMALPDTPMAFNLDREYLYQVGLQLDQCEGWIAIAYAGRQQAGL